MAGAGALGNEVLKLLALMGAGHITVIDFDTISLSNLARMVLFRQEDVGQPKVEMAAKRLHEINPEVTIDAIHGDLRLDIGLSTYRDADLVFGCLDSVNARWALNRKCMLAGVEWLDGGISDFHGSVARYGLQGSACYECNFTQQTYERFNRRYSCPFGLVSSLNDVKVPTTAVTTSVIAAIQVQQAMMMIHGIEEGIQPGERLMVYLRPYRMIMNKLPHNPDCLAHDMLPAEIKQIKANLNNTPGEVIAMAQEHLAGASSISLPFELVTGFVCQMCGNDEQIILPKEKVLQENGKMPSVWSDEDPRDHQHD